MRPNDKQRTGGWAVTIKSACARGEDPAVLFSPFTLFRSTFVLLRPDLYDAWRKYQDDLDQI